MSTHHDLDRHVGARISAARRLKNLSREALAHRLGVTQEQVAGYEEGLALSAGRLFDIAGALGVPIGSFYDGLGSAGALPLAPFDERLLLLKRAIERIAADHDLTPRGDRKRISRTDAINVAREVCERMGWSYSRKLTAAE